VRRAGMKKLWPDVKRHERQLVVSSFEEHQSAVPIPTRFNEGASSPWRACGRTLGCRQRGVGFLRSLRCRHEASST
jgi:hypothetical protein